jgi:hypothetical protein
MIINGCCIMALLVGVAMDLTIILLIMKQNSKC